MFGRILSSIISAPDYGLYICSQTFDLTGYTWQSIFLLLPSRHLISPRKQISYSRIEKTFHVHRCSITEKNRYADTNKKRPLYICVC